MPNATYAAALHGSWWSGDSEPATTLGADGDFYLRLGDGFTWIRLAGAWVRFTFPACDCPGGVVRAVASITEAADTLSGAATVASHGAAAITEAGDTVSAAGTVSGGGGSPAAHYVITTDGNSYPNAVRGIGVDLPGYPLSFDLVVALDGTGVAAWGSPGWVLETSDPLATPLGTPIATETARDATSITINISVTNFADLYGYQVTFDGTQTVNGVTPAFIGELTGPIDIEPEGSSGYWLDQSNSNPAPFLFDPALSPPTLVIVPNYPAGVQLLPSGEAAGVVGFISLVTDGGTSAVAPTVSPVSTDPLDGYAVLFDSGSNYAGYEYALTLVVNAAITLVGLASVKDLNL